MLAVQGGRGSDRALPRLAQGGIGVHPLAAGGLRYLAAALRDDQAVGLSLAVRADSPHREAEVRAAFAQAFGARATAFPPLPRSEVVTAPGAFGFDQATAAELMGEGPPGNASRRERQ